MSLTTRVTLFFLGVLGVVLVAFSLTLYAAASTYLNRQTEERLRAALGTLLAAVEIKPHTLEWNSDERRLTLGADSGEDQVRWIVQDTAGRSLAQSTNLGSASGRIRDQLMCAVTDLPDEMVVGRLADESGVTWVWRSHRLRADAIGKTSNASAVTTARASAPAKDEGDDNYSELRMTAGLSLAPTQRAIRTLLGSSLAVSALLWSVAALVSRRICRRALSPLTAMSDAAKQIPASGLDRRLPSPNTGDELAELATSFNDLLGRVEDAYDRQRRFTAEASHQLRTPLTGLLGQVEVALRKPRTHQEYQSALQSVHEQGLHLTRIVEMLLLLARSDSESGPLQLEEIDLVDWIHLQVERWSDHPRAGDLMVVNSQMPIRVVTHPLLLGQLFDNLLDNAWKYSKAGTSVTVRVHREGERATVEIRDRGMGMSPDDLRHLFEPFFRSHGVRQLGIPGAGLGLPVVQRIARALDITVAVTSVAENGSTFAVIFPDRFDGEDRDRRNEST